MAKKQDVFYFDSFIVCVDHACKAARILEDTLKSFCPEELPARLKEIHEVEHSADCKKHEVMEALAKAFITPIEREDIIHLCKNIDDLVDQIEDVLMRIYCNNVQTIRPDALLTTELIVETCDTLKELMVEFKDFRRSKRIKQYIIRMNTLEEEGDVMFLNSVRDLHVNCTDPLEVFSWHELYRYMEHCMDTCEHIAEEVESVIMKNT